MQRLWIVLLCAACGPAVEAGDPGEGSTSFPSSSDGSVSSISASSSGSSSGGASSATTAMSTTHPATTSDDLPVSESSTGGVTFIEATGGPCGFFPDGVLAHCTECSLIAQDCGAGDGCKSWANDGGEVWQAARCSPLAPEVGLQGEPCTVEGHPYSGIDSCDSGLLCWNVDAETLEGECAAYCGQSGDGFTCSDPAQTCSVYNDGYLPLCLTACDPLVPACDAGAGCYPGSQDNFVCLREGDGVELDSRFHPECPAGTFWASEDQQSGCADEEPCCAPFCDTSEALPCGFDVECVPFFDAPIPEFPNVGYCRPVE